MNNAHRAVLLLMLSIVAGCKVGPNFHSPSVQVSDRWHGPTTAPTTQGSTATTQPIALATWWSTLGDRLLDSLIDRAIQENLELRQAQMRIRQARAARGVTASGFWPT